MHSVGWEVGWAGVECVVVPKTFCCVEVCLRPLITFQLLLMRPHFFARKTQDLSVVYYSHLRNSTN